MQEIECIMSRERITITKFLTRESFLKTEGPRKPEKFENTALFLRLDLSFTKTGKRWLFVFVYTENVLKTELFENVGH